MIPCPLRAANDPRGQGFPGVAEKTKMAEDPFSPDDDDLPAHRTESLDAASERLAAVHRLDGALYRVVEVTRQANGRLLRQGQIWHTDLGVARRFGRALAANSVAQKVQVADADGQVIETIPPPPPGTPAPGWGAGWRHTSLPPTPPLKRRAPVKAPPRAPGQAVGQALGNPAPQPAPAPVAPRALPVMDAESEVERTSTLTP